MSWSIGSKQRARAGIGIVVAVAGALAQGAGCYDLSNDCNLFDCHGGSGGGGGSGAGGGTPAGCVPNENADAVGDGCGVFVASSGDDASAGTKSEPVRTIGAAIAAAQAKSGRVYACAETFAGAVEVPAGVTIYGGLDCGDGWRWAGASRKTVIEGAADEIAVRVRGGEGTVRLEDVAVRAADAVMAGGSSIAVLVDGVSAELVRSELVAGDGAEGAKGAPGAEPDGMGVIPAATGGMQGNAGVNACSDLDMSGMPDTTLAGAAQVANDCGADSVSIGAAGGGGNVLNGGGGDDGQVGSEGRGGAGEPAGMSATLLTPGTAGLGGPGGNADLAMNSGGDGIAVPEQELP